MALGRAATAKKNFDALRSELDTLREDFGSFVSTLKDNGSGRAELDGIRERIATLSNDLQTSGQQQLRKLEDQVGERPYTSSCPRIRDRAHHRAGVRSALMRPVGRPSDCIAEVTVRQGLARELSNGRYGQPRSRPPRMALILARITSCRSIADCDSLPGRRPVEAQDCCTIRLSIVVRLAVVRSSRCSAAASKVSNCSSSQSAAAN